MSASRDADIGSLADVAMGFPDPVHDAQRTFRQVLEALSRPGVVQRLSVGPRSAPAPTGLPSEGIAAVLLALTDAESSLFTLPMHASLEGRRCLKFHTGVREAENAGHADFIVCGAAELDADSLATFHFGTDECPEQGATVIVEVPSLVTGARLLMSGPGIERHARLSVAGVSEAFWRRRIAMQAEFPRGVDLLLVCGHSLVGLPRSTQIVLED